jgi:hypothetical protein
MDGGQRNRRGLPFQNNCISPSNDDNYAIPGEKKNRWLGSKESTAESVNILNKRNTSDRNQILIFSKPMLQTRTATNQLIQNALTLRNEKHNEQYYSLLDLIYFLGLDNESIARRIAIQ